MGSSASLERVPGKNNWIEFVDGELPPYVREIARSIEKTGKTLSSAIAIAISRIKKWAAGGDGVSAKTQSKAVKALAEWESLKAKVTAKRSVKASYVFYIDRRADLVTLSTVEDFFLRARVESDCRKERSALFVLLSTAVK